MSTVKVGSDVHAITTRAVRRYPDGEIEKRWRLFLQHAPRATHWVSPEYFGEPKFKRKRPFAILVEQGSEIIACLTGWHEGSQVISGTQTNPQLVMLDTPHRYLLEKALVGALLEEAQGSPFIEVYSWSALEAFQDSKFWCHQCNATYVVDLSLSEETLFQNLDTRKRNGIRNALKRGLTTREASSEDIPEFYEVLTATHKRLGIASPLPSDEFLTPPTNRKLFIACHQGRCIAGTTVRYCRSGLAEYSENASLPEFWHLRPNVLLLWENIKWAKSLGCSGFNFGGQNSLKKEFGGALFPIFRASLDKTFLRRQQMMERFELGARRLYRRGRKVFSTQRITWRRG